MPETIVMKEIKISKLFHLLYATLLLAPVFAVGVSCVQTAFTGNGLVVDNKVSEQSGDIAFQDLAKDTWYFLDIQKNTTYSQLNTAVYRYCDLILIDDFTQPEPFYLFGVDMLTFRANNNQQIVLDIESNLPNVTFTAALPDFYTIGFRYRSWDSLPTEFNVMAYQKPTDYDMSLLPNIATSSGYQDVFYTSVDKVSQSPFFNWAEKSFLGDGFRYMGNIFGMPTDNPFYTFTCYWCAISILWLIFDVVMYVPKLAHRWLDKGAIE